jgi:prepilin-type N-terminal cleavage/methylation domain-containing protein
MSVMTMSTQPQAQFRVLRRAVLPRRQRGFSLIELLTVVAILAIMATLLAPAVSGFSSTAGRRGAVNIVMNTIDQARVAALEQGREVQVVFWRREAPQRDAILVQRKDENNNWVALTRWQTLPPGILLHKPEAGPNIFNDASNNSSSGTGAPQFAHLPGQPDDSTVGVIEFTPSGTVRIPSDARNLFVILTEGTRETESVISQRKEQNGGFEIISVARYTGRPTLEISEIASLPGS